MTCHGFVLVQVHREAEARAAPYSAMRLGGLKAVAGWGWLHVQVLWVEEGHRGQGFGSRLLEYAELHARDRKCIGACLSSFTFQAPEFYARHGYTCFGQINHYPGNSTLYFMSKRLDASSAR